MSKSPFAVNRLVLTASGDPSWQTTRHTTEPAAFKAAKRHTKSNEGTVAHVVNATTGQHLGMVR